ncbi:MULTISPECIES: peptidoglycan-binding domain-containing protein [Streptomyces]|uniref:Peptidoglycan binding-like domain-containing protein n=1 Tax=Streptomyces luteosporeus TaxID=173856 RepID=A0ABN3TLA7_9ACTN
MTRARNLVVIAATVSALGLPLAGASAAFAATQPAATPVASAQNVSILAVNNLGLDTRHAKNWQTYLRDSGYDPGTIDGQLGPNSWKAAQRMFNDRGYRAGAVDGQVGPNTLRALQRFLNDFGYGLDVDGIVGPKTKAAFWDFND